MNLKRFLSVEFIVVAICLVGIVATGAYLFNSHPDVRKVAAKEENWGFVRPIGPDVRVRGESETTWNKVHRDQNIFRNDRVFTGNSSTAKVNLKSTQNFTVEPNSLVVISDQAETSTIDIDQGSFLGELRKGARLLVKSKGQEIHIDSTGGTIRLEATEEKKVNLIVLKGEASVRKTATSAPQAVKANEEAQIEETSVEIRKLDISLSSPDAGAVLWDRGTTVEFRWQIGGAGLNPGAQANAETTRIEIARDPLFKDIVQRERLESSEFSAKLSAGSVYFWRVIGDGQRTSSSPVSSFSYYAVKPPILKSKKSVEVAANWKNDLLEPATFTWDDPSNSDNYELQISRDDDFHRVIATETTTENSVMVSGLQIGKYFWRVVSRHSAREDLTSDTAEIDFVKHVEAEPVRKLAEAPPEPPARTEAVAAPIVEAKAIAPEAAATAAPGPAPTPVATASAIPTPESTPLPTPILTPEITPVPVPQATPEIVSAPLLKPRFVSNLRIFELSQRDLKSSNEKTILIGPTVAIHWLSVDGAEKYKVKVSWADKSEEFITEAPHWLWRRPRLGRVTVTVTALRGNEQSADSSVELNVILASPVVTKSELEPQPEDAKPSVSLAWISHKLASHTEIQIASDSRFTNPQKLTFDGDSANVAIDEPGVKYFRLRSLNAQGWPVSRYSTPVSLEVAAVLSPEPEATPIAVSEPVIAAAVEAERPQVESKGHLLLTGGIGFGYVDFSQSGSGSLDSASFGSTATPVIDGRIDAEFSKKWGFGLEYSDLASSPQASAGLPISSASFHWKTLSAEGSYTLAENESSKFSLLFGIQKESIPFFSVDSHGNGSVGTNELDNLSLGVGYVRHGSGDFDYTATLRLEIPVVSSAIDSDSYQASAMPMMDGQIGVTKRFGKHVRLGLIWFGQYIHSTYTSSQQGNASNGTQTLMNSNFQLRFGYDFLGIFTMRSLFCWPRRRKRYLDSERLRETRRK